MGKINLVVRMEHVASILVPRNGISSCVLFRRRVRNIIMGVCFFFLFHGTEFRVVFSSAEEFGTEFRNFLFRGTSEIPSEITICSVCSVFHGIIFCRKFLTLSGIKLRMIQLLFSNSRNALRWIVLALSQDGVFTDFLLLKTSAWIAIDWYHFHPPLHL
jgi:hypothetical protein